MGEKHVIPAATDTQIQEGAVGTMCGLTNLYTITNDDEAADAEKSGEEFSARFSNTHDKNLDLILLAKGSSRSSNMSQRLVVPCDKMFWKQIKVRSE